MPGFEDRRRGCGCDRLRGSLYYVWHGRVAQWNRALVFGTRCRGFESLRGRHSV